MTKEEKKAQVGERVTRAHLDQGYSFRDEPDPKAVEDRIYDVVVKAEVAKLADRGEIALQKPTLMAEVWPSVPGPEAWDELDGDECELAEGVYNELLTAIWRKLVIHSTGDIQSRLNEDKGLVLCQTKATKDKQPGVYVTRSVACISKDFSTPQGAKITAAADRYATNMAMAIERVPEGAKKFLNEFDSGAKAVRNAREKMLPAYEAATAIDDGDEVVAEAEVINGDES